MPSRFGQNPGSCYIGQMATFTYFAYGSNMLLQRLQKRCPSAIFLEAAYAEGYALNFSKKSVDGSGKATIAKSDKGGKQVYGALFEIRLEDRQSLDEAEGPDYFRVDEFVVKHSGTNEQQTVTTYIANQDAIDENLVPYDWYKYLVLAGAQQAKLPAIYVASIKAIEAIPDPKLERDRGIEAITVLKEVGWVET